MNPDIRRPQPSVPCHRLQSRSRDTREARCRTSRLKTDGTEPIRSAPTYPLSVRIGGLYEPGPGHCRCRTLRRKLLLSRPIIFCLGSLSLQFNFSSVCLWHFIPASSACSCSVCLRLLPSSNLSFPFPSAPSAGFFIHFSSVSRSDRVSRFMWIRLASTI